MERLIGAGIEQLTMLWGEAADVWHDGGWAMTPIALIALGMFMLGVHIYLQQRQKGFLSVPETAWRRWIDHPPQRKGPVGELLDFVDGANSLGEMRTRFEQLRATETIPFERDLRVMKVCVSAAPLLGLLGTVTGMLLTFGALSSGSGGEKTMTMVAGGISEALITTETGLVIAIPGLFFQYQLARRHERYKAFLAHLENVCTQRLYRRIRARQRGGVRRAARQSIARAILQKLQPNPKVSHGTLS